MVWLVIILVLIVVGLVLYFISVNNGLVKLKNRVESGWAQIDVQLKRRLDLIPNLVETVKGYAAHEKGTLEAVVNARNAGLSASSPGQQAQADNMITGALRQLFALSESYPDLKANQNFLELQEELTATEGRIAYARQFYNESVNSYNTRIEQFPSSIIAKRKGYTAREYFRAEEAAREVPKVQF
jgi:LemA protein